MGELSSSLDVAAGTLKQQQGHNSSYFMQYFVVDGYQVGALSFIIVLGLLTCLLQYVGWRSQHKVLKEDVEVLRMQRDPLLWELPRDPHFPIRRRSPDVPDR